MSPEHDAIDEVEAPDEFDVAGAYDDDADESDGLVIDPSDGALVDDQLGTVRLGEFDDAFVDDHDLLDASTVLVLEEHDNSLVLPVWEPTGDPEVDAALEELASLEELSIHDHADVFTSIHGRLHQRLTDISA
jgi:hypothetical protein